MDKGHIMTRFPNSNHNWSYGIGSDVAFVTLPGIGSDIVLTPGNFQAYPGCCSHFYTQAPGSCVLGCKYQESKKIVALSIIVAPPLTAFLLH